MESKSIEMKLREAQEKFKETKNFINNIKRKATFGFVESSFMKKNLDIKNKASLRSGEWSNGVD